MQTRKMNILEKINDIGNKRIVFGEDFNLFFEAELEAQGGNPFLKRKYSAKLIQINEKFDLCDIWRIRNLKYKTRKFSKKLFKEVARSKKV